MKPRVIDSIYAECPFCKNPFSKQEADAGYEMCEHCEKQKCRVCGCTNKHACKGGCTWIEQDLCSKCKNKGGK